MSKQQQDKTEWKEIINQPDSVTTSKAKSDQDAPFLNKNKYTKPGKKKR